MKRGIQLHIVQKQKRDIHRVIKKLFAATWVCERFNDFLIGMTSRLRQTTSQVARTGFSSSKGSKMSPMSDEIQLQHKLCSWKSCQSSLCRSSHCPFNSQQTTARQNSPMHMYYASAGSPSSPAPKTLAPCLLTQFWELDKEALEEVYTPGAGLFVVQLPASQWIVTFRAKRGLVDLFHGDREVYFTVTALDQSND